ncbi:MAG: hypothetical protein RLY43_769 [Bacteroidota bacterium]
MKKIFLLLALITLTTYGQRKKDILNEIQNFKKTIVNNASYDKKESEVWSAMSIIAREEYNTIVRESESKGYIEARQDSETLKESFNIEISGEGPYRVLMQVKMEKRTKNPDGSYTSWSDYYTSNLVEYFTRIRLRLYELLNGKFELSLELQTKVDGFNNLQTKDRLKIIKGKDY